MNNEAIMLMSIHKVEKAMSMPNRYPVFSQDVIKKIILILIDNSNGLHEEIVNTAKHTLQKYRDCLDLENIENKKIVDFIHQKININNVEFNSINNQEKSNNFAILKDMTDNRHSVRNFLKQNVQYELIEKAVSIANTSPTPCNRQACSLIIIENEQSKNKLLAIQQGNKGFSAPVLGAIIVDKSAFTQENEGNAIYFHAGSFTAGLVLALESLQLSSCILNWHVDSNINNEAKTLLNLDEKEITALIFIGYADKNKKEAFSYKKNITQLVEIIK